MSAESSPVARATALKEHLRMVAATFNEESRRLGLGIFMDSAGAEAMVETTYDAALAYSGDGTGEGELHAEQIITAVRAIAEILGNENEAGLVMGAMQSGKTTTALALQFAGPVYYMVTGQPLYPVYLLTVHTSQAEQTSNEFDHFLLFYRYLRFVADSASARIRKLVDQTALDDSFLFAPSLHIYREHVLRSAFSYLFSASASIDEFVHRRTRGKAIGKIADRMQAIVRARFRPLMIIDEPQFGILDRLVADPVSGKIEAKPTVFKQILREIEERLQIQGDQHSLVALSATPYEMYDVENIWTVHQKLGPNYRGYNFIGGNPIDETQHIVPPTVLSLRQFARSVDVPDLARINVSAFDKEAQFIRLRDKLGISDHVDHDQYRQLCITALRTALIKLREREGSADFGVCIRGKNRNEFARELARQLEIDGLYEPIQYNGSEAEKRSVKRMVKSRARKDIPYLLMVTNRARMGDAFPRNAKYFIELAERFTDMNAMFQGFLGRACGYGKESTVIVSETNAKLINDIVFVDGRYIYKPSQGTVIVGGGHRGRPSTLFTLHRDDQDPIIKAYFERIDAFIEKRLISLRDAKLRSRRARTPDDPIQFAPLLRDAAELGLFEHIERPDSPFARTYPGLHILRPGESVESTGAVTDDLTYALSPDGGCRVTLRELVGSFATGGARARGSLGGDRDQQQEHLEPQILLQKHDPQTGKVIRDRLASTRNIGDWRAVAVVLPVRTPIRGLVWAEQVLPLERTAVDPWVQGNQRIARDQAVAGIAPAN